MAKAHVSRLGSMRSRPLMQEASQLGTWAECHLLSVKAEHISGMANIRANWLSQYHVDQAEWKLHPRLFCQLIRWYGPPSINLFGTRENRQMDWFMSMFPFPGAEGRETLRCTWPNGLLYTFLPIPLIQQVVWKMLEGRRN